MSELPIDKDSWIDWVSCSNCIFKSESRKLSPNMLCSEPPWQVLTTYNSYCGHWISWKTGEEFRVMIIRGILEKNEKKKEA